ncbi:LOW QUALITY PROTEIN: hypothetical protein PHMEG_0001407 [Phytophthora megakarya]|uniref:PiggyBac transposable element-derived protein domain-containing protein n=1 Tax=Phytophthora megakarya TaxID=4795 RepID=A0A225X0L8_9STRA|nr:LOW QUALITY PROTEIN: hypothetical protein PHMEG_0001407 [Phytophthora megakarya]
MNDFARVVSNMQGMREEGFPDTARYLDLFSGAYGPTDDVLSVAHAPLKLLFLFIPKDFWKDVAKASHRCSLQSLTARVIELTEDIRQNNQTRVHEQSSKKPYFKPYEVLHVLGLSIVCMLNPYSRRFRDHWSRHGVGAVSRGTFNEWMSRNWFEHVMTNLHFTNNAGDRASTNRT